jgi:hypothetical protein
MILCVTGKYFAENRKGRIISMIDDKNDSVAWIFLLQQCVNASTQKRVPPTEAQNDRSIRALRIV